MFSRKQRQRIERVYAVGDVHGRFDLFSRLVTLIEHDHNQRGPAATALVLLGDLVDRGPDSARLVRGCRSLMQSSSRFVVLKGNHEAMMVASLRGDFGTLERWLGFGGRETLLSFGVSQAEIDRGPSLDLLKMARAAVGDNVINWLDGLPTTFVHENFLFVHAGIRPGVKLSRQQEEDLLWITDPFLESDADHGFTVVHGHSITEKPADIRTNRIGIDTGAFRTGVLTGLGVERNQYWTLQTAPTNRPVTPPSDQDYYQRLVAGRRAAPARAGQRV